MFIFNTARSQSNFFTLEKALEAIRNWFAKHVGNDKELDEEVLVKHFIDALKQLGLADIRDGCIVCKYNSEEDVQKMAVAFSNKIEKSWMKHNEWEFQEYDQDNFADPVMNFIKSLLSAPPAPPTCSDVEAKAKKRRRQAFDDN